MVWANDGGGATTANRGQAWSAGLHPQFYHVIATGHVPYDVCGSQQDAERAVRIDGAELYSDAAVAAAGADAAQTTYSRLEDGPSRRPARPDVFIRANANGGGSHEAQSPHR